MEDLPEGTTVGVIVDLCASFNDSSLSLDTRLEAARRLRIVNLLHPTEVSIISTSTPIYFGISIPPAATSSTIHTGVLFTAVTPTFT